jgi:hypothetical protein
VTAGGRPCPRCGSRDVEMLPQHQVDDLAADVLEAAGPQQALDLLLGEDRLTACRVAVVVAAQLRRTHRADLGSLVVALRGSAAAGREVAALDELWRLSGTPGRSDEP